MLPSGVTDAANIDRSLSLSRKASSSFSAKTKKGSKVGAVLVSGVGFLADAYDLFVIDFVRVIIVATSFVHPSVFEEALVTTATIAGSVIGQLGFGIAADFIGRRVMFISTAGLIIAGSIASALVGWGYADSDLAVPVFIQLSICRFLLGIGIGGEYPLAATVASEAESLEELDKAQQALIEGKVPPPVDESCWYLTHKPNSIAAVFSMQGVGMLLSPLIVMICVAAGMSLESTWRLCLGIGAVPSVVAFVFRWRMHESAAFKKSKRDYSLASATTEDGNTTVAGVEQTLDANKTHKISSEKEFSVKKSSTISWSQFGKHMTRTWGTLKKFRWVLLGTSATWFLIDVTLYGNGVYKSTVADSFQVPSVSALVAPMPQLNTGEVRRRLEFPNTPMEFQRRLVHRMLEASVPGFFKRRSLSGTDEVVGDSVLTRTEWHQMTDQEERGDIMLKAEISAIIALIALPGYILALLLLHRTGLKRLQFWGFLVVAAVFIVLGGVTIYSKTMSVFSIILFGLTFLFSNFGPNTTTFILPTHLYPTLVRATCHGFSAAMGKLGGVVGTSLFKTINEAVGLGYLMIICGVVSILGAAFTLFIPGDEKAKLMLAQDELELISKFKTSPELNV